MLDWNCSEVSYEHGWHDEKCQTVDAYGIGVRTRVHNFIEWNALEDCGESSEC
jgi:hypothetical protein